MKSTTALHKNRNADRFPNPGMFEPVFTGWSRMAYLLGVAGWFVTLVYFWSWWLGPDRIISGMAYGVVTATVAWVTLIPTYLIYYLLNAKTVRPTTPLPDGRVAMVVTKAPSEPFLVVRKTLIAMLEQKGMEFDVWLADEDPSAETLRWCGEHGVLVSTRKGVAEYHRTTWPRRTRCKEGNLAYFYDHYGYPRYDFVAQFDADHVPQPGYLMEIMRPFSDPVVGYVSAPSLCDANAGESWAARGRLYAEASLHGALQAGYNNGWAPLCIGSHYAVRTLALKQIGGLGPELAEDHSTTLMMNAGGWRGVHAINAIAHGDGPATFTDLVVQEFQWSRSLGTLLLQYSSTYIPNLPPRLKFQFVFSQLWYPLFSFFMGLMFAMPIVALMSGQAFVNIGYPAFILHFLPVSLVLTTFAFFWRGSGIFRPYDAKLFAWEGIAFLFLRWPWSLAGSIAAVRDAMAGSFVDYRITPKGAQEKRVLPVRVLMPYVALAGLSVLAMVFAPNDGVAQGFYIFAAINVLIYMGLTILLMIRHACENGISLLHRSYSNAVAAAMTVLIFVGGILELQTHGVAGLEAITHGQSMVSFTETRFTIAGAGLGGQKTVTVRFKMNLPSVSSRGQAKGLPEPSPNTHPQAIRNGEIMLASLEKGGSDEKDIQ